VRKREKSFAIQNKNNEETEEKDNLYSLMNEV
jgi:hypothetical protein